ncbi:MAG: FAD-dependent monooxygenase [Paracoccaceae bacterium]
MRMNGQGIVVLGAGVAGLAAATALARRGARVQLIEQADAIREVGAGLQISPNGGAVLRALGIGDLGSRAGAVVLRNGADGREVLRMDLDRLRPQQDTRFVHRADLIGALHGAATAAGVEILLNRKVLSVDLEGDFPRVVTAAGALYCAVLIGADGLHSQTRAALNGREVPFFTGQVAWRALIPCEPGTPAEAEVFMGPGRHLVSYPLRGGTLRNIVAVEERRRWAEEGWTLRDDPMDLRAAFDRFDPRVRGWLDQVEVPWLWGLFRHEVAAHWGRALPAGGAAILGDAAHPTLPFLAQGASLALEDAYVLARELDRADSLRAGLAAYQAARSDRARRAVAAADGNARAYHLREPLRGLAHLGLRLTGRLAPGFALSRFDWLYGHDVTAEA